MASFIYLKGEKIEFDVPSRWKIIYEKSIPPVPPAADRLREVRRALDSPIGSPKIEEIARPGMKTVVLFDDPTRFTPAHEAFPEVLSRLNKAGIRDEDISGICAMGTHPKPMEEFWKARMGEEAYSRLKPRIYNHDCDFSDNVVIGRTCHGSIVEVNPYVHEAELIIGIGTCVPHPFSGFGGGAKIIMPGVCSSRSTAEHHIKWAQNHKTKVGVMEGNPFLEEEIEFARMVGIDFKIDFVLNEKNETVSVFCGDVVDEHVEAAKACIRDYAGHIPRKADVTVVSSYPMEMGIQSLKALENAELTTKRGGVIIWVTHHDGLNKMPEFIEEIALPKSGKRYINELMEGIYPPKIVSMGISTLLIIGVMKNVVEKFSHIINVTDGLSKEQVESMNMTYASTIGEAIDIVKSDLPEAEVVVLPTGGTILPIVA